MFEDRARRADGRRRVGVLVSVDADDDTKIPMESQHAVRSLAKRKDIDPRPERRCGKTVMSHTRKGGQASDQANARQPGPAPEQGRTSPIEGTIRGPISFWVTSLPPAPVSDAASQNRRNPDSQSVFPSLLAVAGSSVASGDNPGLGVWLSVFCRAWLHVIGRPKSADGLTAD